MTYKPTQKTPAQPVQLTLSEAHRQVISELVIEVQEAASIRTKQGIAAALDRVMRTPEEIANHPLSSWHAPLKRIFADKPVPPPPPLPAILGPWSWSPIVFDGAPVGGWASLTLFQNGGYDFSGHFHVSGAPSYNDSLVWGVRSGSGILFTFAHSGHLAGTFEPGSRDDDWNDTGINGAIAGAWPDLCAAWNYQATAGVNWDIAELFNEIKTVIGYVEDVIAVVGPLL